MRSGTRAEAAGFTLLEVMVAVFVVAVVMGAALTFVQQNLARIVDARLELRALQLAEERMREIQSEANDGQLPAPGSSSGVFDEEGFAWEQEVEPYVVPTPPEYAGEGPAPSVFDVRTMRQREPTLLRVSLWVYPEDRDAAGFDPFVAILAGKPEIVDLGVEF